MKRYAELGGAAKTALEAYVADVRGRKFPEPRHAYEMAEGEAVNFSRLRAQGSRLRGKSEA